MSFKNFLKLNSSLDKRTYFSPFSVPKWKKKKTINLETHIISKGQFPFLWERAKSRSIAQDKTETTFQT